MRNILIFSTLVLFATSKAQEKLFIPPADSIQSLLTKMDVPGVAIATIEGGVLNRVVSVGVAGADQPLPIDAIFNTASLTKSITAFLTVRLVQQGNLFMDEPLHTYWVDPDLAEDERVKLLTPDIILSHRTGFDNWRFMNEEKKLRFNADPGTKVTYSGEGYEYLRRALENKFNRSFRELAAQYVFDPLKMDHTYLSWSDEMKDEVYAGEFKSIGQAYEVTKTEPNAADDLLTTAKDLGTFCQHLIHLINEEGFAPYVEARADVKPGIRFSYGWIRFDDLPNGEYALFSAGSDAGVSALMCLMPESQRGFIALSNGENRGLVVNLMRIAFGEAGSEMVGRFR